MIFNKTHHGERIFETTLWLNWDIQEHFRALICLVFWYMFCLSVPESDQHGCSCRRVAGQPSTGAGAGFGSRGWYGLRTGAGRVGKGWRRWQGRELEALQQLPSLPWPPRPASCSLRGRSGRWPPIIEPNSTTQHSIELRFKN